ncbi:MAG TPA: hypothetical protein VFE70_06170, partial [Candidatus Elarobacter sp.]|nr:hypothetical protein [Candidatus Elarobacter sp.]
MVRVDDVVLPVPGARTPYRVFRPLQARERFDGVARVCLALDDARPSLVAALSVKTNPRAELMALARERGFFAEVISADELRWAVECGFSRDRTIYNGPQPLPDDLVADPPAIVFADSIEALIGNAGRAVGRVRGVRLRPSMLDSRFGVPVEEDHRLAEVVAATPDGTAVGVSFHARREDFGTANWRDVAADVVERAAALQARSGRTVVAFDPG